MSFLPNKSIKISSMIIVVRAAFHEKNKHYSQVILHECLHKLPTTKSFYVSLTFSLITITLMIADIIYCYLIKYKAKWEHLLLFFIANNKLIITMQKGK